MEILRSKTILVAGLGAVGSYAVEGIARLGVGPIPQRMLILPMKILKMRQQGKTFLRED